VPLDVNAVSDSQLRFVPPEPGLPIDYCVFCYHGTASLMSASNTALLSRFVSDRGALLPRRFTHCCVKHQRALVRTVKRARALNLVPFLSKLHPRARFSSLTPARSDAARLESRAGALATALGAAQSPAASREAAERAVKALTEIEGN
jgi:small subunit ribosomal protein S18